MITCNNFINNKFHEDGSSDYIDVLNPSDGGVVGKVVRVRIEVDFVCVLMYYFTVQYMHFIMLAF